MTARHDDRKRFRESLGSIVARLEAELHTQQRRLLEEITENNRARATEDVMQALAACVRALQRGVLEGSPCPDALEELDSSCRSAVARLDPRYAAECAAADAREGVQRWRYGAIGMPPSAFVRRVLATKSCDIDRDTYVARHKACVEELAIWVAHIEAGDNAMAGRVEEVLQEVAVSVSGHFLFKPWGASLLALDATTGKLGEPQMDVWRRMARVQNPSDAYLEYNSIIHRWWKATAATLNAERQALAAEALTAPGDVELQEEVAKALGTVNLSYLLSATASGVLLSTMFLTTLQAAKMWIHIWPRFPLLTAMVLAYDELAAERAEARSKGALHSSSSIGGGGGDFTGSGGDATVFETATIYETG